MPETTKTDWLNYFIKRAPNYEAVRDSLSA